MTRDPRSRSRRKTDMGARVLVLSLTALVLTGCGSRGRATFRDPGTGLTFGYPQGWSVTGFSHTNSPRRLVVASYDVKASEVEGDCGGIEALRLLPSSGAAVLLIDYGSRSAFTPHPGRFTLSQFKRANYECFGESYMLRFSREGHDIQAHIALGRRADAQHKQQALSILDTLSR